MKLKFILGLFFIALSLGVVAQKDNYDAVSTGELLKLASAQLPNYLEMAQKDNITYYGFYSEDEFSRIELGNPIQTCYLSEEFYNDDKPKEKDYLVFVNEYRIPLMINDTVRLFLIAAKLKEEWKIVGFGEAPYAQQTGKAAKSYGFGKDEKLALLLEPSSRTTYFLKNTFEKHKQEFYPVATDKASKVEAKRYGKEELFTILHEQYKKENDEKDN